MLFANKWLEDEPACPMLPNSWNNTYRTSLLYGSDASWVVGLLLPQSLGNSRGLTNEPPLTPQSSSSFTELVSTKTKASLHNPPQKQISHFSQLTMLELDMGIWFSQENFFKISRAILFKDCHMHRNKANFICTGSSSFSLWVSTGIGKHTEDTPSFLRQVNQ